MAFSFGASTPQQPSGVEAQTAGTQKSTGFSFSGFGGGSTGGWDRVRVIWLGLGFYVLGFRVMVRALGLRVWFYFRAYCFVV